MTQDSDDTFNQMLRDVAQLRVAADSEGSPPATGEVVQGKYRIEESIGQGGMGAVYRATNVENGKQVALKWLLTNTSVAAARFLREGQVAAHIDHPNVVNVFDLGSHRGGRFLVMELLRGETLRRRMGSLPLTPSELVALMLPVLRGLAAAHAVGVIHRDLKPDNVFLCEDQDSSVLRPKILDFGISKLRCAQDEQERLTGEGALIGTLPYMPPEQLADAPNVDERADIYAVGVTMFEALTGLLPFHGPGDDVMWTIADGQMVPASPLLKDVSPQLERVVMRAMAKRVQERHPSAQALIDDLLACSQNGTQLTAVPARASAARMTSESRRGRGRGLALVFVALLVSWLVRRSGEAPASQAGQRNTATLLTSPNIDGVLPERTNRNRQKHAVASLAASIEPDVDRSLQSAQTALPNASAKRAQARPRMRVPSRAGTIRAGDL